MNANEYAEASIYSLGPDSGYTNQQAIEQPKDIPSDFETELNKRKISSYANIDRLLFDRSFDIGYSISQSSVNQISQISREATHSFFLTTGLSRRFGINFSFDTGREAFYSSTSKTSKEYEADFNSYSLGVSFLALAESGLLPQLTFGAGYTGSQYDGIKLNSQYLSMNTTRTMESSSVYTGLTLNRSEDEAGSPRYSRSIRASYALVINHDFTTSLGYSLSKANGLLSSARAFTSLIYRPHDDWILKLSASQSMSTSKRFTLGFDITRTIDP